MKLAPLKWIGLATATVGLSAGGAMVVASASPWNSRTPAARGSAAVALKAGQEDGTQGTKTSATDDRLPGATEQRLRNLERTVEQLIHSTGESEPILEPNAATLERLEAKVDVLRRHHDLTPRTAVAGSGSKTSSASTSSPMPASAAGTASKSSFAASTGASQTTALDVAAVRKAVDNQVNNQVNGLVLRELEAQLRLAIPEQKNYAKLHLAGTVSAEEMRTASGKVLMALATLQGIDDELRDEIDSLGLEIRRKKAEVEKAVAQREVASSVVGRNRKLNGRNAGIVAAEDVAKAEGEQQLAAAQIRIKEIELEESQLRLSQIERRRTRIKEIISWAQEASRP